MLFKSGSFTGTGTTQSITGIGFVPDMVMVKSVTDTYDTWFKTKDMTTNYSLPVRSDSSGDNSHILSLDTDGFTVSADVAVNNSTKTIVYWAAKDNGANDFSTITYAGDATDDKLVFTTWQPDFALIKTTAAVVGAEKFAGQISALATPTSNDASMQYSSGVDRHDLMAFLPGGLYVSNGSSSGGNLVNVNGQTAYGFVMKNRTGYVQAGTYTGNATARDITVGFQPGWVNIHSASAREPVQAYKTQFAGGYTNPWDGLQIANKVSGVTSTAFSLAIDPVVNNAGETYWYLAVAETATAAPPATPTRFFAEPSHTSAVLTWAKVSGATSYKVSSGGAYTTLGDVGYYVYTGLTNSTAYTFSVKATSTAGDSTVAATASATPFSPSTGKAPVSWHPNGTQPSLSVTSMQTSARTFYDNWMSFTLSAQGMPSGMPSGALRVSVPDQNIYPQPGGMLGGTVSEGIGYGLYQLALYSNPQLPAGIYDPTAYAKFNCLWRYTNYFKDTNGLMNWNIGSDGAIYGTGSASDGDYDIAMGLVIMSRLHGNAGANYGTLATSYINAIGLYDFAPNTDPSYPNIALNGDTWGVSTDNYMSDYFRPGFLREYYYHTGDAAWLTRISTNYTQALQYFYTNYTGGVVPDRQTRTNTAISGWSPFKASYNSVRLGISLSTDYLWNGGGVANSLGYNTLDRMATKFKTLYTNAAGMYSPDYGMDGTSTSAYANGSALGMVTPAALMSSGNQAFATSLFSALATSSDQNNSYFNGGVGLMAMSVSSGIAQAYRLAAAPAANAGQFFIMF